MVRRVYRLFNLRDFRLPTYSLVDSQKKNKLESKSKKCAFIGFTKRVKDFRLWEPEIRSPSLVLFWQFFFSTVSENKRNSNPTYYGKNEGFVGRREKREPHLSSLPHPSEINDICLIFIVIQQWVLGPVGNRRLPCPCVCVFSKFDAM